MAPLPGEIKWTALQRLQEGKSTCMVFGELGINQSSVARLQLQVSKELGRQRGSRRRALQFHEWRQAVAILTSEEQSTTKKTEEQVREELGKFVSDITMRRTLRKADLAANVQKKKPFSEKDM